MNHAPNIGSRLKTAFLFPGQGASCVGMGLDVYNNSDAAREVFESSSTNNSVNIADICFFGPEDVLSSVRHNQACIFLAGMAIAQALKEVGVTADAVAGQSLGEYTALAYAGSFSTNNAIPMLMNRGEIMAKYIPEDTGMAAIFGLVSNEILELCKQSEHLGSCEIAIYSTPTRSVITGDIEAINKCAELCKERGAKVMPVGVSRSFHSKRAQVATNVFRDSLDSFEFKQPVIPVYYNRDGTTKADDIKEMEIGQLTHSVNLVKIIENMLNDGVTRFIKIGPGGYFADAVKEIARIKGIQVEIYTATTYEDVQKIAGNSK